MLERFTPETQALIMRAHALAQAGQSNTVDLVHVWVTALESDTRFQDLVRNAGASLPEFFLALPGEETHEVATDVPLSANVKWMLETALWEMVSVRQHQVTPWAVYMALAKHSERLPASITVDSERIIAHLRQPYFQRHTTDSHRDTGIGENIASDMPPALAQLPSKPFDQEAQDSVPVTEPPAADVFKADTNARIAPPSSQPLPVPPLDYDFSAPTDEGHEPSRPANEVPPMPPIPPAFSAHDAAVAASSVDPVPPVAPVPPPPIQPPHGTPQPIAHPPLPLPGYPPIHQALPFPPVSPTAPVFPPHPPTPYPTVPVEVVSSSPESFHVPTEGVIIAERDGRQTVYIDGVKQFSATDGTVTSVFDTLGIRYTHVRFVH